MANKIYDPKTMAPSQKGGVKKSFSHPHYNYLGHFKDSIKDGHKKAGSMAGVGLHPSEMMRLKQMKEE